MKAHPLSELLPMLDDKALRELADDIREHGLREPIATLDGLVLDGRNRLRACELAGVKPTFVAFTGDPLAFVASKNLHRRHLTASQRALVAARIIEVIEQEGRRRREAVADGKSATASAEAAPTPDVASIEAALRLDSSGRTADRVASVVGASGPSTERARRVLQRGVPEVVDAVLRGRLAVSAAANLAGLEPEEQRRRLEEPRPKPAPRPTPPSSSSADDVQLACQVETAFEHARKLADVAIRRPTARALIGVALSDTEAWLRRVGRSVREAVS